MGPNRDDEVWVVRPFDIDIAGEYTVRFEGDAPSESSAARTDSARAASNFNGRLRFDDPSNGLFLAAGADYPFEFAAGRHWFSCPRLIDDDADGAYTLTISPGWSE